MRPAQALALSLSLLAIPTLHAADRTYKVNLKNAAGQDTGNVTFKQDKDGVAVKIYLRNLPVGQHAVHIHATPKCEGPGFTTAGGHFNPDDKKHGFQNPMGHHDGDLPENVSVNEGPIGVGNRGSASFTLNYISLDPKAPNSITANGGVSVVVHEKADDMATDPTGNAGNRLACGVLVP